MIRICSSRGEASIVVMSAVRAKKLILLTMLAVVRLAPLSLAATESDKAQAKSGSRIFNGVRANFVLANGAIRQHEPLKILFVLRNVSHQKAYFSLTAPILHIRVYDGAKREVDQRSDAPVLEAAAQRIRLASGENYKKTFSVDLWAYYDLAPGKYYLRFYYDLRLLDDKALIKQYEKLYASRDLVLWDTQYYPFRVVP